MRPFFNIKATSFFDFKSKLKFKVKPAALLKVTLLDGCFLRFLNCTNSTKLSGCCVAETTLALEK